MSFVRSLAACLLWAVLAAGASAQHTVSVRVTDEHTGDLLVGATVRVDGTDPVLGASAGADGVARIADVPAGAQTLLVSFVGLETARVAVTVPTVGIVEVALEEHEESMDDLVVGATRTSRTIADAPTRVEVIAGEEIDEKISMEPSNITMLLNESPGIVVQQTSAVSGNASIRIQGLDGRYTQLLKDGFPLYGGFAGGLSLLQVPPLDLRQVEIIKGPASTLYGGGAIAGLVNLVSKTPGAAGAPATHSFLANVTSADALDLGAFSSGRTDRFGYTLLAAANGQNAYDPDGDAFTNLAQSRRVTVAPKAFVYGAATTAWLGLSVTSEEREGGDIDAIRDATPGYTETTESLRLTSQARLDHDLSDRARLTLKQSTSRFDRQIDLPGYRFEGAQTTTYSEASAALKLGAHDVVAGLDLNTDAFDQTLDDSERPGASLDDAQLVAGAFVQDTWDATDRLAIELGLRGDVHDAYGLFVLPRVSALVRIADSVSLRATGGLGYKAPTVFLEASERRAFQGVLPLADDIDAETSVGGTVDLNVQTLLGERVTLSLNQAVFLTRLNDALVPSAGLDVGGPTLRYRNAAGAVLTRGSETNARFGLGDLKLFLGYVYLDATESAVGRDDELTRGEIPLTPAHKTYSVLVWEQHGRGRVGLEAYYTSPQRLADGERTPGYWVTGIMGQWSVGPATLFLNLENMLDTQQTDYAPVVLGDRATPRFADLWAPTDGFIVNGGVKLSL